MAEEKVRVLEKNPGVGEEKEIVKGSKVNVDKYSRKREEIRTDKKKETKDTQPKIFSFCKVGGGGGGVLGPFGNLPTNPIKQGIKGEAPKMTKKQPFCSVGGGGGLLGPYLISPTTSTGVLHCSLCSLCSLKNGNCSFFFKEHLFRPNVLYFGKLNQHINFVCHY